MNTMLLMGSPRLFPLALIVWLMIVMLGLANPAVAESRVALVIGNAAYQDQRPLSNTLHDARDVAGVLEQAGFKVITVENGGERQSAGDEREDRSFSPKVTGNTGCGVGVLLGAWFAGEGQELPGARGCADSQRMGRGQRGGIGGAVAGVPAPRAVAGVRSSQGR